MDLIYRLLRARTSRTFSPTSALVVVLPPLAVPPLLVALPLRPPLRLPRRRVRFTIIATRVYRNSPLTQVTEKEESDEDMGFGLFD